MSYSKTVDKLSTKTLLTIFLFLLAVVLLLAFGKGLRKTSAAWFDDSWMYRKAVNITNGSGSNLTDFQVSSTLDTATLITNGKMQSDCNDIRIVIIKGIK